MGKYYGKLKSLTTASSAYRAGYPGTVVYVLERFYYEL